MFDHPYITDPNYSTTVLSWYDGGLHFFRRVPSGSDGFELFNVFHLAYGTIFVVALAMCHLWWKRGSFRVRKRQVLDSVLVAVAAIIIGGRLGEAMFYQPEYFFSQPMRLITNASGFTIHGMILFTIIAFWFWARWIKRPWFHLLDQSVIFVAFGTILGRVANFLGGDLWGREGGVPWAVRFPLRGPLFRSAVENRAGETFVVVSETPDVWTWPWQEAPTTSYYLEPWQPDQTFESLPGGEWETYHVGGANSDMLETVRMLVTTPRHPSQLYQAITEGVILLIILIIVRRKATRVGQLSAWFLVCYGGLRMVSEFFRQPEPGLGYLLGLTRGQLLSLSMVLGGFALFVMIHRKPKLIADIPTDAPGFTPQVEGRKPEAEPAS
ncbi:MAG: prolipoprotein diacylglyceryl transferase [Planctomycetes bacterium]|nr:prolipoprotein diacylglyceryl transferase [Planctomycetota bacterium]